jgi:cytochrome P450
MRGLSRLPVVGDAPSFFADRLGFLERRARDGDVVEIRVGRGHTLLLAHPDDIRHVLVTDHRLVAKNSRLVQPVDAALFGEALVAAPKAAHAPRRRALQPAYQHRHLGAFAAAAERCADEAAERWLGAGEVDLAAETEALARRTRIHALLGPVDAATTDLLTAAVTARQRFIATSFLSPVPHAGRLPSRARRRYRRTRAGQERIVGAAVAERLREPRDDVLTHLIAASGDGVRAVDEARTFLASYEVSSRLLAWGLYLLAHDLATQARLAGAETGGAPGFEQQVVSEALRLYPPSWLFVRVALEPVELPAGRVVRRGTRLFLSPYVTHRDPRWFPEPARFDPERFAPGPALRSRPRHAYFPFGGGPHVCIGEGLVRLEAALTLTRLCRRLELAPVPGARATPSPRVTLELAGAPRLRVAERRA